MKNLELAQLASAAIAANDMLGTKSASASPEDKQVIANLMDGEGLSKKAHLSQLLGTAELVHNAEVAEAQAAAKTAE